MKQETTIYTMQIKQCSIQMHSKGKFKQLHKPIYKNSYVLQIIRGGPKRERRAIRNKKKVHKTLEDTKLIRHLYRQSRRQDNLLSWLQEKAHDIGSQHMAN